jgi:hypothetical protein
MSTGNLMIDLLGLLLIGFGSLIVIVLGYAFYLEFKDRGNREDLW